MGFTNNRDPSVPRPFRPSLFLAVLCFKHRYHLVSNIGITLYQTSVSPCIKHRYHLVITHIISFKHIIHLQPSKQLNKLVKHHYILLAIYNIT